MAKLQFKIATPDRVVYEASVEQVTCPTQMGEVTILPNHIPLVANLKPGELKVVTDGQSRSLVVAGGFLEVRPKNEVVVLADAAEHIEEIDLAEAEAAKKRAERLMSEEIKDAEAFAEAEAMLERSLIWIKAARHKKYKDVGRNS